MYKKSQKIINAFFDKCKLSYNDINKLCTLSKSRNSEVRSNVAVLLGRVPSSKTERVLYSLSFDKDEIVKIEAVDSLAIGSSLLVLQRLKQICFSENSYLRFYGFQSYCDVFLNLNHGDMKYRTELLNFLKINEEKERDDFVLASIYKCKAICGDAEAVCKLIQMHSFACKSKDYHLITPVYNLLLELRACLDNDSFIEVIDEYVENWRLRQQDTDSLAGRISSGTLTKMDS